MELMMSACPPGKGKSRKKGARKKAREETLGPFRALLTGGGVPHKVLGQSSQESASEDGEGVGDKGREERVWRGCGGRNLLTYVRSPVMILAFA